MNEFTSQESKDRVFTLNSILSNFQILDFFRIVTAVLQAYLLFQAFPVASFSPLGHKSFCFMNNPLNQDLCLSSWKTLCDCDLLSQAHYINKTLCCQYIINCYLTILFIHTYKFLAFNISFSSYTCISISVQPELLEFIAATLLSALIFAFPSCGLFTKTKFYEEALRCYPAQNSM